MKSKEHIRNRWDVSSEAWTGSEQQEATLLTWFVPKKHPVCQFCSLSGGTLGSSHSPASGAAPLWEPSCPLFFVKFMGNWVPCGH